MIDKLIVQKTLNAIRICKSRVWGKIEVPLVDLSGLTSTMIYNIFGGEILKRRHNNGWHFYNQIDGKSIDSIVGIVQTPEKNNLQDLPALPEETHEYFEQEDYLTFYMEFISKFEEEVGLEYNPPSVAPINRHLEYKA
ncbi:MAG: hypothetical protein ACFCUM_19435 [Bacteroidales bacterium]